jgi:hypothetical protein
VYHAHTSNSAGLRMRYKQARTHIDVPAAAKTLIAEFGSEAPFISAQRADAFLARGDLDGARQWRAVYHIVADAQKTIRSGDDRLH